MLSTPSFFRTCAFFGLFEVLFRANLLKNIETVKFAGAKRALHKLAVNNS
jgi:hypothetical protein